jgi:hypothetical protein
MRPRHQPSTHIRRVTTNTAPFADLQQIESRAAMSLRRS